MSDKYTAEKWLEDRVFGSLSGHFNHEDKIKMLRLLAEIKGWVKPILVIKEN